MNNKENNVVPFKKAERFMLCRGTLGDDLELTEYEQVGVAYLKAGSKNFRVKLWMFPTQSYFMAPDQENSLIYSLLSMEEYQSQSNEKKVSWQKVGSGEYIGIHIKMKFHLLSEDIYLCLFPDEKQSEEFYAAS